MVVWMEFLIFAMFFNLLKHLKMKKILISLVLLCTSAFCFGQSARDSLKSWSDDGYYGYQRLEVKAGEARGNSNFMVRAGNQLERSSLFECGAWVAAIGSGLALCGVVFEERETSNLVGGALGVVALLCEVASIHCKFKSGAELKAGGGGLRLTF